MLLQTCRQATGCPPPEITPRSCLDYSRKGFKDNGYYKIYNFQTNTYLTVYCDFTSEPGAAWTLIESFALKNNNLDSFRKHPFSANAPVNDKTPNWNLYRMSFAQMKFLRSQSTHWRVTCNFPETNSYPYDDYAQANFADFDVLSFTGYDVCKKMEYVNIRGHHCVQCTATWFAVTNTYAPHIDSSFSSCQFLPNMGNVVSEDNFGFYSSKNNKFKCSSSPSATTNWWFGSYII